MILECLCTLRQNLYWTIKDIYEKMNIPSVIQKRFPAYYLQFHLYKMMYHMMLSHHLQIFR